MSLILLALYTYWVGATLQLPIINVITKTQLLSLVQYTCACSSCHFWLSFITVIIQAHPSLLPEHPVVWKSFLHSCSQACFHFWQQSHRHSELVLYCAMQTKSLKGRHAYGIYTVGANIKSYLFLFYCVTVVYFSSGKYVVFFSKHCLHGQFQMSEILLWQLHVYVHHAPHYSSCDFIFLILSLESLFWLIPSPCMYRLFVNSGCYKAPPTDF